MGLDNSIILRTKHKFQEDEIPSCVKNIEYTENEYQICYWRKCWNIRGVILDCISDTYTEETEDGEYDINNKHIDNIINGLCDLLKNGVEMEEEWLSECIWSFDEMIPRIAQNIVNLSWLKQYMINNTNYSVVFIDSY